MSDNLQILLLVCLCVGLTSGATKCQKIQELGDAPDNVYYCYEEKPECCERDSEFTCCESDSSRTWKDQLQLWGTVAGVIAVMLLVCCCFKSDGICNGGEDGPSFLDRFRRKKKEPALTDLNQTGHADPAVKTTSLSYDRLPPLPPVTPLSEKADLGYRGRVNAGYDDDDDGYYR